MSRVEEHGRANVELQSAHQILPIFTIQSPPFQVSLTYHSFNAVLEPCGLVYLLFTCFQSSGTSLVIVCSMSLFSARVPCRSNGSMSGMSPVPCTPMDTQQMFVEWMQWKGNKGLNKGIEKTENRDMREIRRIKVVADGGWEVCLKIMRFQASDWKIVWAITWEREFTRTGGMGAVFKQRFLQYLLITMLFPFSFHLFLAMQWNLHCK